MFCPEHDLASAVLRALQVHQDVTVLKLSESLGSIEDALSQARLYEPNCVFISLANLPVATRLIEALKSEMDGLPVVGLHPYCDESSRLELIQPGIVDVLAPPFRAETIVEVLQRVRARISSNAMLSTGTDLVYTFLPAKPGAGSTTLALNTAIAAAKVTGDPVCFADFDLSNGVARFMLGLDSEFSIVDAAEADLRDHRKWAQLPSRKFGVDFLHAGALRPETRVAPLQAQRLVRFLRRPYKMVFADVSGNFEQYSIEVMRQSKRIFLVTTPEMPSLYLAKDRMAYLRRLELGDSVSVLLNRVVRKSAMSVSDISALLGAPVFRAFDNDYAAVSQSLQDAVPLRENCELGRQIRDFARLLPEQEVVQRPEQPKSFLSYFTLASRRPAHG